MGYLCPHSDGDTVQVMGEKEESDGISFSRCMTEPQSLLLLLAFNSIINRLLRFHCRLDADGFVPLRFLSLPCSPRDKVNYLI